MQFVPVYQQIIMRIMHILHISIDSRLSTTYLVASGGQRPLDLHPGSRLAMRANPNANPNANTTGPAPD